MSISGSVRRLLGFHSPVPKTVHVGGIPVGKEHPIFFIAEIGINHNGDVEIAKRLIDAAVEAGAQAVKFQKRTVPVVYSAEELAKPRPVDRAVLENAVKRGVLGKEAVARLRKSDFKDSTNGDLKWALEFTEDEYRDLFSYANAKGILAFASPWDEESVDVLERLGVPCLKVASASITDHGLLIKIKDVCKKPVILSTGMSSMEEVHAAVNLLGTENLILLHTVSTYPSEDKDLNLKVIYTLRRLFPDVVVGYSGHERGTATSVAAATLGAHLIERHVTLDKKMFGSDQSASMEPAEFKQLVADVRSMEAAFGDGVKRIIEAEIPIQKKLRRK